MSIRDIFPVKIYETEFENFVEIQQDLRNKIKPLFETNTASGNDYFDKDGQPIFARTNPNIQYNPDLQILKDFINRHVKLYWQACNYTSKVDPYVMQMWANDVPPGGFTPAHNHNPVPIAGVFYVDADEHQGNLYLEDPLEIVKGKMPYDFLEKPYLYTETITVKPGKLVLFPGWLRHHVRSNRATENRIVVGLNAGAFVEFKPEP
jgi:uncharacterized protein (TIGR02466 family)